MMKAEVGVMAFREGGCEPRMQMAFSNWKSQGRGSPLPQGLQKECSPVDLLVTSDLQTVR